MSKGKHGLVKCWSNPFVTQDVHGVYWGYDLECECGWKLTTNVPKKRSLLIFRDHCGDKMGKDEKFTVEFDLKHLRGEMEKSRRESR